MVFFREGSVDCGWDLGTFNFFEGVESDEFGRNTIWLGPPASLPGSNKISGPVATGTMSVIFLLMSSFFFVNAGIFSDPAWPFLGVLEGHPFVGTVTASGTPLSGVCGVTPKRVLSRWVGGRFFFGRRTEFFLLRFCGETQNLDKAVLVMQVTSSVTQPTVLLRKK